MQYYLNVITLPSELILKGDKTKEKTNGGNKRDRSVEEEIKSIHIR